MDAIWWILIILLFVTAFIGLLVPVLPDIPLMVIGFALYHFLVDSHSLNLWFWVGAVLLAIVVTVTDYVAGGIAVKTYGGSRYSTIASILGAGVFGLLFPPWGILFGPVVAVILVELSLKKSFPQAVKLGFGTLIGFLGGVIVKGVLMAGLLIWFIILVLS
ncbi:DUF456 family protein [Kroppenstedtia pulmonis]|uniref:DUF456 family protein n=1 Tax=Kroppenstedtia pulmonis TaxID=1380685 RepID=A0A7D3Y9U1_9BACL|nr:DUF456 family protein [Kroppenstedtia pulmonis]QKG84501.1 DUF456 family protein [Kroppenstedtia pulmonis]